MSIGKAAMNWLQEETTSTPPKGWRSLSWIAEKKKMSREACRIKLINFIRNGEIPQGKKYKIGCSWTTHYFVGE